MVKNQLFISQNRDMINISNFYFGKKKNQPSKFDSFFGHSMKTKSARESANTYRNVKFYILLESYLLVD
jgi:hypothetical protein